MRAILTISFLVMGLYLAEAQQRFGAGIIAGGNFSQIDGDLTAGYNKPGWRGGFRVNTRLSDKKDIVLEILYSERGSRSVSRDLTALQKINLQMFEVPVLYTFKDWLQEDEGYYKVHAHMGLSGSVLFQATSENAFHSAEVENFNRFNMAVVLGASYFFSEHIALGARFNRSLTRLWSNKNNTNLDSLIEKWLSVDLTYMF